ncbi:hypothetical protein MKX01_007380 [Papaver californicum]|nr:hypothetical protein MKX01_007380 [Papaver californicum]
MAETAITTTPKRSREETQIQEVEEMKRQKTSSSASSSSSTSSPYNQILSILETEEEEEELVEDISSLITSLQQEISTSDDLSTKKSSATTTPIPDGHNSNKNAFEDLSLSSSSSSAASNEDEEDKDGVIRHLLEASDDELGIPQIGLDFEFEEDEVRSNYGEVRLFDMGGYDTGLWEFEDETANYYTLLQSELFM